MKEQIYIDGDKVNDDLPIRSLFYGEGIFETFRYKNKMPVMIDHHLSRMKNGADLLTIPLPSKEDLTDLISKAVAESEIDDAYVKVCLLSKGESAFYEKPDSTQVLVIVKEYAPLNGPLKLKVNSFNTLSSSPLKAIKSTNYMENVIARRESRGLGYDEALFLNESGEVVECSASNIFWYKDRVLYTPSIETGCLPGTTRGLLLDCISDYDIDIVTGRFLLNDMLDSEFVFVTNSLIGCNPIVLVEGNSFASDHELFTLIKNTLFEKLKWP